MMVRDSRRITCRWYSRWLFVVRSVSWLGMHGISALPHIKVVQLAENMENLIVLGSDGLFVSLTRARQTQSPVRLAPVWMLMLLLFRLHALFSRPGRHGYQRNSRGRHEGGNRSA
jgi:hypothetical protein